MTEVIVDSRGSVRVLCLASKGYFFLSPVVSSPLLPPLPSYLFLLSSSLIISAFLSLSYYSPSATPSTNQSFPSYSSPFPSVLPLLLPYLYSFSSLSLSSLVPVRFSSLPLFRRLLLPSRSSSFFPLPLPF